MNEQAQQTQPAERKFSLQEIKRDSIFMMVTSKLSALSRDMESLELKAADDVEMAALFRSEAMTYLDKLEQIRMKYKRPFLDHMTETDKAFKLLGSPVLKALDVLDVKIRAFLTEEKRKADEEAKRIEEENKKKEEDRLKLIEVERAKLEQSGVKVDKTAEEIAKESTGLKAMITGKVEVAPGIEMAIESPKETTPAPLPQRKLSEQTGGLLQGKSVWKWEVIKEEEIPQNYLMLDPERCDDPAIVMMIPRSFLVPNNKLIDAAVTKSQVREIQGLHIFEEIGLASKKFKK